jgi:hypothetical protein
MGKAASDPGEDFLQKLLINWHVGIVALLARDMSDKGIGCDGIVPPVPAASR